MKRIVSVLMAMVLCLSFASVSFAKSNEQGNGEGLNKYAHEYKEYVKQLEVTEEEPYKEVKLIDGTILFNEIKVNKNIAAGSNSITAAAAASNQQTYSMTSTQGYKNVWGMTLYKLDYTTVWTFDYNTVISSYSYTSVDNGVGWSFKDDDSFGPVINNAGRQHQWTGTAKFAMIVAGIDINNETLINLHRVNHDGTYSWKYETGN